MRGPLGVPGDKPGTRADTTFPNLERSLRLGLLVPPVQLARAGIGIKVRNRVMIGGEEIDLT
jgi:hypothetical protein